MNKKTYKQPSMKVIEVESLDIICTSTTTLNLFNYEVDEEQKPDDYRSSLWGSQW